MRSLASVNTFVMLPIGVIPMLRMSVTMRGAVHVMGDAIPPMIYIDHGRAVDDPPRNRSGVHPHIDVNRLGRNGCGNERDCDPDESEDECSTVHG